MSDLKIESKISTYDEDNPKIEISLDGYMYSFTVRNIKEESREWMLEILTDQLRTVHQRAVTKTRLEIQYGFQELLGLK